MINHCVLQESQNGQPQTSSKEEMTNRSIRTILKKHHMKRELRPCRTGQPHTTDFIRRGRM